MTETIHSTVSMEYGEGCVLEVGHGLKSQPEWHVNSWATWTSVSLILGHKHIDNHGSGYLGIAPLTDAVTVLDLQG